MELSSPYPRSPLPVPFPLQTPSVISDQTQIDEQSSTDLNRNYRTSSAPTRLPPLSSLQLPEFDVSKLRAANAPEKRHSSSARRMSLKKSDVVVRRRTSSVPVSSQIDSRRDHYSNSPSLRPVSADVGHLEPTVRIDSLNEPYKSYSHTCLGYYFSIGLVIAVEVSRHAQDLEARTHCRSPNCEHCRADAS